MSTRDPASERRVTVYAHFGDRKHLLEALLERALQRVTSALASAGPDTGPAPRALERLIAASWQQLARNDAIARGHRAVPGRHPPSARHRPRRLPRPA
jgi:AcrR family transcriptional regulator